VSYRTDRRSRPRARRGFTLIELLVVIAIIATLAAIVAPSIFRNVGDAKTSAAKSQVELLALALNSYRLDNDVFPTTDQGLEALRTPPTVGEAPRNWRGPYQPHRACGSMGPPVRISQPGASESPELRSLLVRPGWQGRWGRGRRRHHIVGRARHCFRVRDPCIRRQS